MKEFAIRIQSVQDIQKFVSLATAKAFPVYVRDRYTQVNGKSFMEMFCLNFTHPLFAVAECEDTQLQQLREEMQYFLA